MPFSRLLTAALTSLVLIIPAACASADQPKAQTASRGESYSRNEVASAVSDYFGVTAEAAGTMVEKIFKDLGEPNGYIYGEEASGAIGVGLRYGKGTLQMANGKTGKVYWQGPSVGFDTGGDASKVFTLVYGIQDPNQIYQRFPGVNGSAYLVAGIAVNYQRSNTITLVPMRTGVGVRLGANVGYLAYSRKRHILPF